MMPAALSAMAGLPVWLRRLLGAPLTPRPEPWWLRAYQAEPAAPAPMPLAQQRELDQLLSKARPSEHAACYASTHGYLTAIVVGPPITPWQWLPHLLGDWLDRQVPEPDTAEKRRLLALLSRLQSSIEADVTSAAPQLDLPVTMGDEGEGEDDDRETRRTKRRLRSQRGAGPSRLLLEHWCTAFMVATQVQPRPWARLRAKRPDSALHPIWLMGTQQGRRRAQVNAYVELRGQGHAHADALAQSEIAQQAMQWHSHYLEQVKACVLQVRDCWRER
jgi:Uncharacterised protein family (UPF0149)